MDKINGYNAYEASVYGSGQQNTARTKSGSATKGKAADQVKETQLSAGAKRVLKELQEKYGDKMDIMAGRYDNNEQAASYLSRGIKQYSVLIHADELEAMAKDGKTKEKYMSMIDDATSKLDEAKEQLGDKAEDVVRMGISVGKDGKMSFFADLEQAGAKQRERIEQSRADKKEAAKAEEKKAKKRKDEERIESRREGRKDEWTKTARVESNSLEDLISQIQDLDWDSVKAHGVMPSGGRMDYTI
ncbi:MAG: hypothetical protein K2K87_10895 [Lachnospiraceae bacterium]|nr:hypothetical protein [Lachnospiraceae bacterium]